MYISANETERRSAFYGFPHLARTKCLASTRLKLVQYYLVCMALVAVYHLNLSLVSVYLAYMHTFTTFIIMSYIFFVLQNHVQYILQH